MISLDLGPSFPLGRIIITPSAIGKVPHEDLVRALKRQAANEDDDKHSHELSTDEFAFEERFQCLSAHCASNGVKFWAITEADRSRTTLMLPEDYGRGLKTSASSVMDLREIPQSCVKAMESVFFAPQNMVKGDQRFESTDSSFHSPRRPMQETNSSETSASMNKPKQKPIHEVRLGFIKAAVWRNETEASGVRYNVTFSRLFKDKDGDNWRSSDSFNRDGLLLLGKVADRAHSWIFAQAQNQEMGE